MSSMFKISEAGAIALHAAAYMAACHNSLCPASEMTQALSVSEAHLVKVLQRLTRAGLVEPARGRHGGYRLLKPPAKITLRDVFEAIEGRLTVDACLFRQQVCDGPQCILHGLIKNINTQAMDYFNKTTLDGLTRKGKHSGKRHRRQ
ncbi:RrF2 family transcriptional regulator [Verrucomicrobiota bacterium]